MVIIHPSVKYATTLTPEQAALVREWTSFCHDRKMRRTTFMVDHETSRYTSRWTVKPRVRPWIVKSATTFEFMGAFKTLEAAIQRARELSDMTERIERERIARASVNQ